MLYQIFCLSLKLANIYVHISTNYNFAVNLVGRKINESIINNNCV